MKDQYKTGLGLLIVLAISISATIKSSVKTVIETPTTCSGDIYLSSQAQVDSFPSSYGCHEISGTLTISGNDIVNLDSLYFLTKVDGDLNIINNPNLTNLRGLSALTYAGAGVNVNFQQGTHISNNPNLSNLDGLNNLASIAGMLEISDNAKLTNLDALAALTSIASTPTSQSLAIVNNPSLISLNGLHSITSLRGQVAIGNNAALPSLSGLDSVTLITGDLYLSGNASLTNLSGLGKLASIGGGLKIDNNAALTSLDGLSSLKSIGHNSLTNLCLTILSNPTLVSLKGLGLITSLNGNVNIQSNAALPNLDGLDALVRIEGFPGGLTVDGNTSLTNINALSSLSYIGHGGVSISNNPALTNLNGLSSLTIIDGYKQTADLTITNNSALADVDGLSSLSQINGAKAYLTVTNNFQLARCCGLYHILNSESMNCFYGCSYVTIAGNGSGCTREEIQANCLKGCIGDVYLASQDAINTFPTRNCRTISGTVTISGSDITNLDSLYVLTSVGNLVIENTGFMNSNLTTLRGLSGLTEVKGDLIIRYNTKLQDLQGLAALTKVGGNLTIDANPLLTNIGALSALDSIALRLTISSNSNLTNVNGLSGLRSAGSLFIQNSSLTNVNGLMALASYLDLLEISNNNSLSNLSGLSSIKEVGTLNINGNGSLNNIDGLSSLAAVHSSISLTNNSNLTRCCGLYPALHHGGTGTVTISGNGAGCTEDDILAGGPCCSSPDGCPQTEPTTQPTNMIFSAVTDTTMTVSFTAATPAPTGYITLMQAYGAPYPNDVPVDGTIYHTGDVIGSSTIVINAGNDTTLDVIYLLPNVDYYFDVFSYNISNGVYDYRTVNPLEGNQRTSSSGSPSARIAANYTAKSDVNNSGEISKTGPFPNPFSESITIPFTTSKQDAFVQIAIYDLTGRKITDVVSQNFAPGYHEAKWMGTDYLGSKVSQGIYIYRIRTTETEIEAGGLLVAK